MKDKTYVREVIIGTLLLIVISLILILTTKDIFKFPSWFFENLFLGVFTLFGAYFGAKTAGKFAIASVEKQIESNNEKELRNKHEIFSKNYMSHKPYFQNVIDMTIEIFDLISESQKKGVKSDIELIKKINFLDKKLLEHNQDITRFNINELSYDYYKDIHLCRKILENIPPYLYFMSNYLKNRDIDEIVSEKNYKILVKNFRALQDSVKALDNLYKESEIVLNNIKK